MLPVSQEITAAEQSKLQAPEPVAGYRIKPFFENLDTLRFFSFLVVFLFHVRFYELAAQYTSNTVVLAGLRVLSAGGWGVTFFFVLSGFLITWLMLIEQERYGKVDIKLFYIRRVLRIWPLYYLVFIAGVVVLPFLYQLMHLPIHFDYKLPLYALFLSNYGYIGLDPAYDAVRSYGLIMNISWSVSIEEQFYLVWPLLFLLKKKYTGLIFPGFILLSCIAAFYFRDSHHHINHNTLTCIGQLAIGGWAAYLLYRRPSWLDRVRRMPGWLIGSIYAAAFAIVYLSFARPLTPVAEHLMHLAGGMLFALVILEQNFSQHSLFKFGRLGLAGRLGKISYGLYMLHPIAMFVSSFLLQLMTYSVSPVNEGWAYVLLSFGLTILFAALSYRLIERPLLVLKKRFEHHK